MNVQSIKSDNIKNYNMTAVEVHNLYKSYNGKLAVKDLSFSIDSGEILGLIGPNGAGKSSTIKIILDFIKADTGEVKIFGNPINCRNRFSLQLQKQNPVMTCR